MFNFRDLPVVFLSYDEPNADENWNVLQKQNLAFPLRSHGVLGFDAAHKAACVRALTYLPEGTNHFFTVDGDTQIFDWVWNSSYERLYETVRNAGLSDFNKTTFSWRSINNVNELAYGNGGLKLWSVKFVEQMKTHESSLEGSDKSVDFCWLDNYIQMEAISGRTIINGSPYQAWRAGFREGMKLFLQGGSTVPKYQQDSSILTSMNFKRILQWISLGEDVSNGLYAIHGTLSGFAYVYLEGNDRDVLLDYDQISKLFWSVPRSAEALSQSIHALRTRFSESVGLYVPSIGIKQSKLIKTFIHHKQQSMYDRETWTWIK